MKKIEELEKEVRAIGKAIKSTVPEGVGFALLLFDFGKRGNMSYVSSADRADMIRAFKELIANLEGAADDGPAS